MLLDDATIRQIGKVLAEENVKARFLASEAANDAVPQLQADDLRRHGAWWWYPRCPTPATLSQWRAFSRRRIRFALGLAFVAILPTLGCLITKDPGWQVLDGLMTLVVGVVAGWQFDVGNRELQAIETIQAAVDATG